MFVANGTYASDDARLSTPLTTSRNHKFLWPTWRVRACLNGMRCILCKLIASPSALGVPIENVLVIDGLRNEIPKYTSGIAPNDVVRVGALGLQSLSLTRDIPHGLRVAYTIAVSHVNYFLVAVICISVPTAFGMEWLNIEKVSA